MKTRFGPPAARRGPPRGKAGRSLAGPPASHGSTRRLEGAFALMERSPRQWSPSRRIPQNSVRFGGSVMMPAAWAEACRFVRRMLPGFCVSIWRLWYETSFEGSCPRRWLRGPRRDGASALPPASQDNTSGNVSGTCSGENTHLEFAFSLRRSPCMCHLKEGLFLFFCASSIL